MRPRHRVDKQHDHNHDALVQRDTNVPNYGPRSSAECTRRLHSASQLLGRPAPPGRADGEHFAAAFW